MLAGALVTLIGLGVVAIRLLGLPRDSMPVAVGIALLTVGVILRIHQRRTPWRRT